MIDEAVILAWLYIHASKCFQLIVILGYSILIGILLIDTWRAA